MILRPWQLAATRLRRNDNKGPMDAVLRQPKQRGVSCGG